MGVSEFLQTIKGRADELAILEAPVDAEDLSDKILEGLGDDYKELTRAVQARDNPVSFDELHEKLLNFEASLQHVSHPDQSYFPAFAYLANRHLAPYRQPSYSYGRHTGWRSPSNTSSIGWCPSSSPNTLFSTLSQSGSVIPRPTRHPSKPYFAPIPLCTVLIIVSSPSAVCSPHQLNCEDPTMPQVTPPTSPHVPLISLILPTPTHQICPTEILPAPSLPTHPMQTRAKNNIHKPINKLNLSIMLNLNSDLEPTISAQALQNPKWR
uniref:Uncharacterized protein n=1 Tax=Populus alba TaxID=43335 RepID=A0A4U5PS27_POPAL|nr:hypothetical protein D5086_0000183810 [Populus alba]